jgi:phage-related protein
MHSRRTCARFLHIVEMLESFGPFDVREPYVKPLGDKLFEMCMRGQSGIARAIYVAAGDQRLVVLHVFVKKTSKTPHSAIRIARERLGELA